MRLRSVSRLSNFVIEDRNGRCGFSVAISGDRSTGRECIVGCGNGGLATSGFRRFCRCYVTFATDSFSPRRMANAPSCRFACVCDSASRGSMGVTFCEIDTAGCRFDISNRRMKRAGTSSIGHVTGCMGRIDRSGAVAMTWGGASRRWLLVHFVLYFVVFFGIDVCCGSTLVFLFGI